MIIGKELVVPSDMKEVLETAREVYQKTMCGGAGCCGDIDGALEYIDGAVAELILEVARRREGADGQED